MGKAFDEDNALFAEALEWLAMQDHPCEGEKCGQCKTADKIRRRLGIPIDDETEEESEVEPYA